MYFYYHRLTSIVLTLGLCLSLPITANAEKKKKAVSKVTAQVKQIESEKPKWKEEPTSFLGIKLDQPLNTSVSLECPSKNYGSFRGLLFDEIDKLGEGALCYFTEDGITRVWNIKVSALNRAAVVTTDNALITGNVGNISMEFKASNFEEVKNIMTVKYGAPHSQQMNKVKTNGGAEFDNENLDWSGNNVSIHIESLARREADKYGINSYGLIIVSSTKFTDLKSKSMEKSIQDSAGKL